MGGGADKGMDDTCGSEQANNYWKNDWHKRDTNGTQTNKLKNYNK